VMGGMAILAAGLLVFLAADSSSSYLVVLVGLVLCGAGVSLIQPPASAAMMSSVSAAKAGMASGTNAAIRQIGASFGIAVMGGIGQIAFSDKLTGSAIYSKLPAEAQSVADSSISGAVAVGEKAGGSPGAELIDVASTGFVNGMHLAVIVAAGFAVLGLVLAGAMIPKRTESEAEHRRPAAGV